MISITKRGSQPVQKPDGDGTPPALGWTPSMSAEESLDSQSDGHACPTCEREFDTNRGLKIHHKAAHGESIAGVTVTCAYCGERKRVKPNRAQEYNRHFCDDSSCKAKWQAQNLDGSSNPNWDGGKETIVCDYCGAEKTLKPSVAKRTRFCSYECQGEWRSENWIGSNNPLWRGGDHLIAAVRRSIGPVSWKRARERAREQANNRCEMCGSDSSENEYSLHVHHIVPVSAGGTNSDWNLMVLCADCHKKAEIHTREFADPVLTE